MGLNLKAFFQLDWINIKLQYKKSLKIYIKKNFV